MFSCLYYKSITCSCTLTFIIASTKVLLSTLSCKIQMNFHTSWRIPLRFLLDIIFYSKLPKKFRSASSLTQTPRGCTISSSSHNFPQNALFLEKRRVVQAQLAKKFPTSTGPSDSFAPYSQEPATCPYPESDLIHTSARQFCDTHFNIILPFKLR